MVIDRRYRLFCTGPFDELFATMMHDLGLHPPVESVGVFCFTGSETEKVLAALSGPGSLCTGTGTIRLDSKARGELTLYRWSAVPLEMLTDSQTSTVASSLTFGASGPEIALQIIELLRESRSSRS